MRRAEKMCLLQNLLSGLILHAAAPDFPVPFAFGFCTTIAAPIRTRSLKAVIEIDAPPL